ncbi:MAG: hypothetical protein M3198_16035 [Actinomycetota bacterium]|nr:hypothetical protein [Actinomycetota bacterium]
MRRAETVVALVAILGCALAAPASASWGLRSTGSGFGKAAVMPSGVAPSTSVTGRKVTVTWRESSLPGGGGVQNYRVRRYSASSGVVQNVNSSCDANVDGLSCTEAGVPAGSWAYTVTPREGNWVGTESSPSSATTVSGPSISFSSPTNVTSLDAVLNGDVSGFVSGRSLTFRLDNAVTGPVLSASTTPVTIPSSGSASFSVTIPRGTSAGSHTVHATDGTGESAAASIKVDIAAPMPTLLTITNGGGNGGSGRIAQGDSFQVTFSRQLDVSSMCSTWSGDAMDQSIATDNAISVKITNNASLLGNDLLSLVPAAGTCGGSSNFGSLDLGSPSLVLADATFGGVGTAKSTVSWTPSTRILSVTLGALQTGTAPSKLNTSLVATYTPHPSVRNTSWIPITGTVSRTGVLF